MPYLLNGTTFDDSVWERFWSKVDIRGEQDCWEWKARRDRDGYGQFRLGTILGAHRIAFMLTTDDIPDRLLVCHDCDNPSCCNPMHLFVGTNWCNSQDAVGKRLFRVLSEGN